MKKEITKKMLIEAAKRGIESEKVQDDFMDEEKTPELEKAWNQARAEKIAERILEGK